MDLSIRKSRGQAIARETFNLVHARWPDADEAKNTATMALWLAQVVIYPAEPLLKGFRLRQRTIALVWLVAKSNPGIRAFGQDGCIRLGKAAANYACLHGEKRFFCDLMAAQDGANVLSRVPPRRTLSGRRRSSSARPGSTFKAIPLQFTASMRMMQSRDQPLQRQPA